MAKGAGLLRALSRRTCNPPSAGMLRVLPCFSCGLHERVADATSSLFRNTWRYRTDRSRATAEETKGVFSPDRSSSSVEKRLHPISQWCMFAPSDRVEGCAKPVRTYSLSHLQESREAPSTETPSLHYVQPTTATTTTTTTTTTLRNNNHNHNYNDHNNGVPGLSSRPLPASTNPCPLSVPG